MKEESFLLVSLKEDKAKKLAQVITNDTCRKILDYLAKKPATETEIAEKLNLPLSTVHYNMQNLVEAKLVNMDEFHYSKKGKEINHYSLSNKFIIIAPKEEQHSVMDALKKFLPVSLIVLVASGAIQLVQKFLLNKHVAEEGARLMAVAPEITEKALVATQDLNTTPLANTSETNIALWFLIGSFFVLLVLFLWELIKNRRK
jgi:DNA-binding transcriptional ArsR family regulator